MTKILASDLTEKHFGKTLHFEDDFYGRHYVSHGELTSIANEMPYFWTRHSVKPYKIYKGTNREEQGHCDYEYCGEKDCYGAYAGPLVVIELDDDEMLELEPYDELEIVE